MEFNPGKHPVESDHISPKLVNIIFLAPPGGSRLEWGITQGEFCALHRNLVKILCKQWENFVEGAIINYKVIFITQHEIENCGQSPLIAIVITLALPYYAIWFQCSFHFYMIHLCYMYRVIIGGNLVRFSTESGMQKTMLISLDCHLPYLIQFFCLWKILASRNW